MLEHLASCDEQRHRWRRVQKVTAAAVWKELKEKERRRIPPHILYTALYGETEAEEVETRKAIIRGLMTTKTEKRLYKLLDNGTLQRSMDMATKVMWNAFYDHI